MESQCIFQAVYTEQSLHAVADSPAQYKPRVPINDRHQIGKALAQPDVGDELAARMFVGGVVPCLNAPNFSAVGQLLRASQSFVFMEGYPLAQRLN